MLASCGPLEHGAQLEVVEPLLERRQLALQLGLEAGVLLGQFDQGLQVAGGGVQLLVGLEQAVERLELADDLLGLLRVVPEVGLRPSGR